LVQVRNFVVSSYINRCLTNPDIRCKSFHMLWFSWKVFREKECFMFHIQT